MPHCCPQKQQCVFTSFSAGLRDSSDQPPGGVLERCGPNCSRSSSAEAGSLATVGCLLDSKLCPRQRLSLAGWTELLPVTSRSWNAVVEAELRQGEFQVVDLHS